LIEYEMEFANFPKMTSQIELAPTNNQVRVSWASQGKLPGGPFYGYFAAFFSSQMRSEYERSLDNLKLVIESASGDAASPESAAPESAAPKSTSPETTAPESEANSN
jgi:hypothetical protein